MDNYEMELRILELERQLQNIQGQATPPCPSPEEIINNLRAQSQAYYSPLLGPHIGPYRVGEWGPQVFAPLPPPIPNPYGTLTNRCPHCGK